MQYHLMDTQWLVSYCWIEVCMIVLCVLSALPVLVAIRDSAAEWWMNSNSRGAGYFFLLSLPMRGSEKMAQELHLCWLGWIVRTNRASVGISLLVTTALLLAR
jgi:hypothetical protein